MPQPEPPAPEETIPAWVVQLVGRLTLENELLRAQLNAAAAPPDLKEPPGA